MDETRNKKNGNIEELLKTIQTIDELFDIFNTKDLRRAGYYQIASLCYKIGYFGAIFERESGRGFENNPNYQKAVTRLKILRNKFYKEAQRRDEEEKCQ